MSKKGGKITEKKNAKFYQMTKKKKRCVVAAVGFEPTPPKRLVP